MLLSIFSSRHYHISCNCANRQLVQQGLSNCSSEQSRRSLITKLVTLLSQILMSNVGKNIGLAMSTASPTSSGSRNVRIIDSHLHVWANTQEAASSYPYQTSPPPPSTIIDRATPVSLLSQMSSCGVDGALIVQPINHKFDHSYVIAALQKFPHRLKGMLLYDPSSQSVELALRQLQDLLSQGFVAVRFNPSLWPAGLSMSDNPSLAVYKRCGELGVPVGIMCFNGLHLHFEDICKLIQESPSTPLIIDHFGFTRLQTSDKKKNDIDNDDDDEKDHNFTKLLSLSKFPNVYIKIAALFRIGDTYPYEAVKVQRFLPLLKEFGPQRLIFGTDFPYCLEVEGEYCGAIDIVFQWTSEYGADVQRLIMGENSERLFGKWEDRIQ